MDVPLSEVEKEMAERDDRDMNRETAPLRRAEDAVTLLTDDLSIDQVTEAILSKIVPPAY